MSLWITIAMALPPSEGCLRRGVPCYRPFPARLSVSGDGDGQMRILMIIAAAAPLMGCEIAAFAPKADESSDYQASTDRYLACIIANSNEPQQCEVARVLMEADGRRYNNALPGTVPGR